MTLNQIQYFYEVARRQNYRAAAEELHISQPSLSRAIANLEEELGVALFEKSGRGVVLTKAGRIFQEFCQRILADCNAAARKMEEIAKGGGTIDLGYVFPLAGQFIPRHVRAFLSHPGNEKVHFNFWQNHTPAIMEKIKDGSLDVGFGGCIDLIDLDYCPLLMQEMIIAVPLDHPLAKKGDLPLSVLDEYPVVGYDKHSWMGIHTKQLYEKKGLHPHITSECPDEYSILALVREKFGIALVPKTDYVETCSDLSFHSIDGIHIGHQIYMFWKKDGERLPVVDRFIAYMKSYAKGVTDSEKSSIMLTKDIFTI